MIKKINLVSLVFFVLVFLLMPVMALAEEVMDEEIPVEIATKSLGTVIFENGLEIILTIIIITVLISVFMVYRKAQKSIATSSNVPDERGFGEKLMDFLGGKNTKEELELLDLKHDYDGISELDNNIPAWWNLAFAGTIVFAIVYLIRVFITGGIPDQIDELKESQRIAAIQIEHYLATSANNVDENTVVMLGEDEVARGKEMYDKSCVACHAPGGAGGIGPNLADEYWLHGGNINDIFYSIKYGWPDKGMISWKDQFSPMEIAEIASYIKSLKGTTPDNPKEPEGELYKGE